MSFRGLERNRVGWNTGGATMVANGVVKVKENVMEVFFAMVLLWLFLPASILLAGWTTYEAVRVIRMKGAK